MKLFISAKWRWCK